MNNNIDNDAIRLILQPSMHLYAILEGVTEEEKNELLHVFVNEKIDVMITMVNELIEKYSESRENNGLLLSLALRAFITELRRSFATVRDLMYHKQTNDAMVLMEIVKSELAEQGVNLTSSTMDSITTKLEEQVNHPRLAQELYYNIMQTPIEKSSSTSKLKSVASVVEADILKKKLKKRRV